MRLDRDQPLKHFQAFVVAGGYYDPSSVVTLLPGATAWTSLASLPRGLVAARAIIVAGGRILVWVWDGAGSVWRQCGGLQHEVEAGGAAAPQHHLGAGGGQDGAEDHETSPGQGLHHVSDMAVLLMDGLG